ncbi:vegetative storage protein Vsp2 [Arabidopsis thaliana]|jgi:acid phosphatase|uniref:Vegetative storage protein 2 n=3 Tax=Arabidopsis thaliana TaxID=3702 RepID=VSP2_ARATH|nr:vegetative storage protein 2 [Arabidopsis thaliana]O82122.1 RecName: Full=Vegetative storage protein 2; Flags: Precursor [Arabidopsis thaliana]AAK82544.1 AT5g24770/T4C12_40 [Arabidopsis thaliana]AAK92754.1 putative vegetative storage protein Vsp2 [Arabidopsis thaliana]AAM12990.1 vegetative storage protein Vsp2 [Arabidopsis thaliana]AAM45131.1 putative vegetative storage protein Vsp2 [Arabidopsis thaliana]AAM47925.1 vegetative storage protein Vsp2 [Arabidopsis thaliana]|eukprot:NP_568454.1 vegetative storage protein 2 [Arabidopsis thaliana]
MKILSLSLLLLLAATVSASVPGLIELVDSKTIFGNVAELLEKEKLSINYANCRSWHLGVETSNIIDFDTVPANCKDYVEDYLITSKQYQYDSKTVCKEAYFYAKGLALKNDTVNVWIFDLDDTLLSSIPYYAKYGYGTEKTDPGAYWLWLGTGASTPGLPEALHLYQNIIELGIEPIILSDRWKLWKNVTLDNLEAAGVTYWKHLILKPNGSNLRQVVYKSKVRKSLVKKGYNIVGNIGDQWADLVEDTPGRVFKLPNPLYYVPS